MTGKNDQGFEQEGGNYTTDDERLKALIESGEIPDDVHDIEAALSFDSNDKGKLAGDGTDTAAAGSTETDDTTAAGAAAGTGDDTDTGEAGDNPAASAGGETAKPGAGDSSTPAATAAGESDDKDGKQGDGDDAGGKPDGVLTRDGKNVIPYGVLESERTRARTLAERNRELEEQLQQLQSQRTDTTRASGEAEQQLQDAKEAQQSILDRYGISADDKELFNADGTLNVEKAKDEFSPDAVRLLAASNQLIVGLSKTVEQLADQAEQQAAREARLIGDSVQDAIDATPGLAAIQAAGGPRWELARSYDRQLREDPTWQAVPMRVRFAEVDHVIRGGDPRTPDQVLAALSTAAPAAAPKKPDPASQPGNPQERAAQILRESAGDGTAPSTHSDLPAGERPIQDGPDRLEQMNVIDLEQAFESAADPDALIAKLIT